MDALCPLVESSTDSAHDRLTLGAILRAFLPALLHLLKLGKHKLRVLLRLAACGTPALGANLFACPHCPHRHWARAPAVTGIVRAAWPPKADNGYKSRHGVSYRSLTTIASSPYQQNLIPWS
jgi:hypothetical protein